MPVVSDINNALLLEVPGAVEFREQKGLKRHRFGGGSSSNRTLIVCVGMEAQKWAEMLEKSHFVVWFDGQAEEFDWAFTRGHDVWIRQCGFVTRSDLRKVAAAVEGLATRILYQTGEGVRWSI